MLVDRRGSNALPLPDGARGYTFQNQADLIAYIEKFEIYGLKSSSLEEKFGKANSTLRAKITA
jgi:hypothetical protein